MRRSCPFKAKVRGSCGYTVNPFYKEEEEEAAAASSASALFSKPCARVLGRGPISDANCLAIPSPVLFRWEGRCVFVFGTLRVSSPPSLRRCIPVDFHAVLLQLSSKESVVVL